MYESGHKYGRATPKIFAADAVVAVKVVVRVFGHVDDEVADDEAAAVEDSGNMGDLAAAENT